MMKRRWRAVASNEVGDDHTEAMQEAITAENVASFGLQLYLEEAGDRGGHLG